MHRLLTSAICVFFFAIPARAQILRCIENSPERHGQPGCSVVADKPMPSPPPRPAMWHIDEFSSLAEANHAVGPNSVVFEAFGSAWLYTIESDTSNHHGGKHRATVVRSLSAMQRRTASRFCRPTSSRATSALSTRIPALRPGGSWRVSSVLKRRRLVSANMPVKALLSKKARR